MALIVADRVTESSTTTGTGAFTLAGAYTGYRAFSAVCATSDTVYYCIEAIDANGNPSGDWETGLGTYSGANTLTRTTPSASSNAGAAVNFAAGTKRVSLNVTATQIGTYYKVGGTDVALADGGTGASLVDPNADRMLFWDDSAGAIAFLTPNTGLSISGTSLNASGGSWALAGTGQTATGVYDFAVDGAKANVDFIGLSAYNELLIIARNTTTTVSGVRQVQVSVNNGSTFYSTSGDYILQTPTATETATTGFNHSQSSATAARNLLAKINNTKGPVKWGECAQSGGRDIMFVASTSDIDAIRFSNSGGGNVNGGTVRVYAR